MAAASEALTRPQGDRRRAWLRAHGEGLRAGLRDCCAIPSDSCSRLA
jgi:hypothetical protein